MTLQTRALACTVRAVEGDENRDTFEFVASTENEIRVFDLGRCEIVRESLQMGGARLRNFTLNPVVLDAHRKRGTEYIVGKAQVRVESGQLIAAITFDSEPGSTGERNLRLVRKGMLRALSIGYSVRESEVVGADERSGEQIVHVGDWELIEISTTSVPADPDTLKRTYMEDRMDPSTNSLPPTPAPASPPLTPEPAPPPTEPPARSVEEEGAAALTCAAAITEDTELRSKLVRYILRSEDPAETVERLDKRRALLHARTNEPKLRALGGKLIAEADDPLGVDIFPALRRALAEDVAPVGTPPQPERKPKVQNRGGQPKPQTELTGTDLVGLLRS